MTKRLVLDNPTSTGIVKVEMAGYVNNPPVDMSHLIPQPPTPDPYIRVDFALLNAAGKRVRTTSEQVMNDANATPPKDTLNTDIRTEEFDPTWVLTYIFPAPGTIVTE